MQTKLESRTQKFFPFTAFVNYHTIKCFKMKDLGVKLVSFFFIVLNSQLNSPSLAFWTNSKISFKVHSYAPVQTHPAGRLVSFQHLWPVNASFDRKSLVSSGSGAFAWHENRSMAARLKRLSLWWCDSQVSWEQHTELHFLD